MGRTETEHAQGILTPALNMFGTSKSFHSLIPALAFFLVLDRVLVQISKIISLYWRKIWAGVKSLLYKHSNLSSEPQNPCLKQNKQQQAKQGGTYL